MSNRHLISLLSGILSLVFSTAVFAQPTCPLNFIDSCAYVENSQLWVYFRESALDSLSSPIVISWSESGGGSGVDTTTVGTISDGSNPYTIFNLGGGLVDISVSSGNGCISVCTAKPYEPPPPCTIDIALLDFGNPTCEATESGYINLSIESSNGGLRYEWNDGSDVGPSRDGLTAGTYTVTVTDEEGCVGTFTKTLTGPSSLIFSLTTTPDNSNIEQPSTGSITISGDLNNPPYAITLVNQDDQSTTYTTSTFPFVISQLPPQYYNVTVRDGAGCENTQSAVLVGRSFVVPPHTLFVVEFDDDISQGEYTSAMAHLDSTAILRKQCRCGKDGIVPLQLWESGDELIELFTSGEGSTIKMKPDTVGLGIPLISPEWDTVSVAAVNIPCIAAATAPANPLVFAIIDSGIALPGPSNGFAGHKELANLYWTNNFNPTWQNPPCVYQGKEGYDFVSGKGNVIDTMGHGTILAGIFKQSLPFDPSPIKLMNLKVCSPEDTYRYSLFDLICAIHYAVDSNAQVINLSMGYKSSAPSSPLYNALRRAEAHNIPVVVSAGNAGENLIALTVNNRRWPVFFKILEADDKLPSLSNLLVVTSLDSINKEILDPNYSNFGKGLVDIATKGDFITTTNDGLWGSFKGTSLSTAYVSSIISIVKSYKPNLTVSQLFAAIQNTAIPIQDAGKLSMGGRFDRTGLFNTLGIPVTINWGQIIPASNLNLRAPNNQGASFQRGQTVRYLLRVGTQITVISNVTMIIKRQEPGSGTAKEIFRKTYCATDMVEWTIPLTFPITGQNFMRVEVNGQLVGPSEIQIVVIN